MSSIEAGLVADALEASHDLHTNWREQTARRDAVCRRTLAGADLASAAGAIAIVDALSGQRIASWDLVMIPIIALLAKLLGRYDSDQATMRSSTLDEIPALCALGALWAVGCSLLTLALGDTHAGLGAGRSGALFLCVIALLVVLRTTARIATRALVRHERILIVGSAEAREGLARSLGADPGALVEVVGFLPLEDERRRGDDWDGPERRRRSRGFADLSAVAGELEVDRVLLLPTTADSELMLEAITDTLTLGLDVSIVPRLFEVVGSAVEFDIVGGVTVLGVRRPDLNRSSRALKRTMDILGAGLGLVLLSPLFFVIAIAIKLDTRGPVFFRQERVGREGRRFRMLKFRSMIDDAAALQASLEALNETDGLFKIADDPRVTRTGRIVRRLSLDELPQLINVLAGDMSLVGPRPLVVDEDRLIEGRHRRRLLLAPGMTGPWQVLGPARPPLADMVKTDYLYTTTWSLWTDVKILIRTLAHMTARRGR